MQTNELYSTTVVVRGLKTGPLTYGCDDNGTTFMQLEEDLGWLFHNNECDVLYVAVTKTDDGESDGWGCVTFEDEASVQRALKLTGTSAKEIEASNGSIEVERAKRRKVVESDQRLAELRDEVEAIDNEVRLREARSKQLGRDIEQQREKQSELSKEKDNDDEIKKYLAMKNERLQALQKVKDVEADLHHELRYEEKRTENLETVIANVDPSQTRRHAEQRKEASFGNVGENADSSESARPSQPKLARSTSKTHWFGQYEVDVPNPETLVRSTSVRSDRERSSTPKQDTPADAAEGSDWEAPTPESPIKRTGSASPWALKRQQSRQKQQEQVVEDKKAPAAAKQNWGDMDPDEGLDDEPKEGTATCETAAADNTDATTAARQQAAPLSDRQVRLINMPAQPRHVLVRRLKEELARVWKTARNAEAPVIERLQEPEKKGWAAVAAAPEFIVTFESADDAAWLVDNVQRGSWARIEHLTIRGKIVTAEWAAPKAAPAETLVDVPLTAPKPAAEPSANTKQGEDGKGAKGSCKDGKEKAANGGGKGKSSIASQKGGGKGSTAQQANTGPTVRPEPTVTVSENPRLAGTAWGKK